MGIHLLNEAYKILGYNDGALLNAVTHPSPNTKESLEWLEKGDWLALANKIGAEKIFFVKQDPVIVFKAFQHTPNESELLDIFRRTWCMARPQQLFLAKPGVLEIYDLNNQPPKKAADWSPIKKVDRLEDVAKELFLFHRESIESGYTFADNRFSTAKERADNRLIEDLKIIRKALLNEGLDGHNGRYAHALIGRSIFTRYLEDRRILTREYFENIAKANSDWEELLLKTTDKPYLNFSSKYRYFDRILLNKDFTYALFEQLAHDFNGDMFPRDEDERSAV